MKAMTLESPFLQFALRHDVAAAATVYLGLVPIIQFANVYHSSYASDELAKSQLYHCDSDEVTQMKVFVFCEDVSSRFGATRRLSRPGFRSRSGIASRYRYKKRLSDEDGSRPRSATELVEEAITGPRPGPSSSSTRAAACTMAAGSPTRRRAGWWSCSST